MPAVTPFLIACLAAYLIGSIPFGYLIGKAHGVDIREKGSGNIGATNLGRIVGKFWGQLCFLLDLGKGAGPVLAYGAYAGVLGNLDTFRGLPPTPEEQPGSMGLLFWITVGMCAVLGHIFPIYLRFRGGKGVATGFGVMLGMWPQLTAPAFGALFVWYVTLKLSRYVGIASCAAAASLPFWYILWRIPRAPESFAHVVREVGVGWPIIAATILLALLVIYKHRGNIQRVLAGTEPKIGE
jgi:acyl phosphate:glycerol-3-phosphate acyltransferase